jgi:2-polyprenyl-3-methyl-5-hydroxy-6-metoxy-1,4-benzoquinol methylase
MNITTAAIGTGERVAWPDPLLRAAISMLVGRTRRRLHLKDASAECEFARRMAEYPIAIDTQAANEQHYEVPTEFFALMLGPQRKYSCCYYARAGASLAEAEERALAETAEHAALADGQRILELGCGWGSLSLWMARRYPAGRIVAVSNSRSQRASIAGRAEAEGLRNLTVIAADINGFTPPGQFDRVVSVEMFEHMSNWSELLRRIRSWLTPQGALFLHNLLPSPRALSLRCLGPRRLDRAALLYRRHHAEPRPHPAVRRSRCGRTGMAVGRHALPAHRGTLAQEFRPQRRSDRRRAARLLRCRSDALAPALAPVPARDRGPVRP